MAQRRYLDLTGLTNLVTNIRAWVASIVPTKTSELNNDANFITSSDLPTNHVTTDTTQTITGSKTFQNTLNGTNVIISGTFAKKHSSVTKGTNPESKCYCTINLSDKNGINYSANSLGQFETALDTNGIVSTYMRAISNTANSSATSQITAVYDTTNNTAYATCPTPAANSNDTKIATTAWVTAKGYLTSHQSLANYVTLNGVQTITGDKSFSGLIYLNGYNWVIRYKTQGTSNYPNYDTFKQIEYSKHNNIITLRRGSDVYGSGDNFNVVDTTFAFYKIHIRSKYIDLVDNVRFLNDGTNNVIYPITTNTTNLGSSSNQWNAIYANSYYLGSTAFGDIVTHNASEFLTSHQSLSNYVTLNGTQTISGQKTFTANQFFTSGVYQRKGTYTLGNTVTDNQVTTYNFVDSANAATGYCRSVIYKTSNMTSTEIAARNKIKNGALDATGDVVTAQFFVRVESNGTKYIAWEGSVKNNITPYATNAYNLGSSTAQWNSTYTNKLYLNGTEFKISDIPTKTSNLINDNRFTSCLNTTNVINFDWSNQYPGKIGICVDTTWLGGILTTANTTIQ